MQDLELVGIEKKFGSHAAVQEMDLHLGNGVHGLLGENGAGKTTLMRMLCGILSPTNGQILCDGMDIRSMGGAYRRLLGYLPQDFGFYPDFTARRFLDYISALKALPAGTAKKKIDELLELVGLMDVADKKLKTFSGGMLRRIGIVQALLNEPEILVLDEPTAGLDPKERVRFRNIISSLGKDRIVLLSTHIVTDVDYIADQIHIMKRGEMVQSGTQQEITGIIQGSVWNCLVPQEMAKKLNQEYIVSNIRHNGELEELRIVSKEKPVENAVLQEPVLEDAYLYYAQESY